jgi:mono/diheme cytochrome c family protein
LISIIHDNRVRRAGRDLSPFLSPDPRVISMLHQLARSIAAPRAGLTWRILLCSLAAACSPVQNIAAQNVAADSFSPYVDAGGGITLPKEFTTTFVHLGTIAVAPKEGEPVHELHATYTRPQDLQGFRRNGSFPDGAVLVKEVRATTNEKLTTGAAAYDANVKIWFVMIKDAKGRFPDNELWGDGWGWGLFDGKEPAKQIATDYRSDCRTCHVPARQTDWVYTKCYPALSAAVPAADSQPQKQSNKQSNLEARPKPNLAAMFPQWAAAKTLPGDPQAGRTYFETKKVGNTMTCATCHSFDPRDSMSQDGDGLIRAGFPVYAAAHRTNIKNSGTNLVALGGNVCVLHFMGGKDPGMAAQDLANLDAFFKTGGGKDHPTAVSLDYAKATWTVPENLSGGDATRGGALAMKTCITCHDVGSEKHRIVRGGLPLGGGSFAEDELKELALQIRNPNYEHNAEMPGYTDQRLSNRELLDLIAWFRKPR